MREECIVTNVKGRLAYIKLAQADKCGGCKACLFGKGKVIVPALMEAECKKGDDVVVEMPAHDAIAAPFILYLMPILFLLGGFFLGMIFRNELIQVALALSFAALSFLVIWLIDRVYRQRKFMPVIIKVVQSIDDGA